ncbi:uncharacterized protein LOC135468219 [Liolophura sinensis]|uniref:uncharacterized protein LOC135468219 n=1 Tax=Liolophura sinensis TaxID=3198878 RepID=UPI0031589C4B
MAPKTTVIEFLVFGTVWACIAISANPVDNSGACARALQTTCREEVVLLNEPHSGNRNASCKYLSAAIACIACKVQNCSHMGETLLQQFNYCRPNITSLILLQGKQKAIEICLLMTTTTTTKAMPVTSKPPTTTTQAHSSGKQIQDQDYTGSSSVSRASTWVVIMAGLLVLVAEWR